VLRLTSDGILLEETSGSFRGCNDLLQQSEKYSFSMFDLSLSVHSKKRKYVFHT